MSWNHDLPDVSDTEPVPYKLTDADLEPFDPPPVIWEP